MVPEGVPAQNVPGLDTQGVQGSGQPRGFSGGWNEGFFIQSEDRNFIFRITGQMQADERSFENSRDRTDIDQFLLRRARLGIEADMFKYYEFRLMPDFAPGQQSKSLIQDAYMNVHYWDCFQVMLGRFKQPFSYEELVQDRFVPTMERSMLDQMTPQRDNGVMLHGKKLFDNRLDWAIALSDGDLYNDIANSSSNSDSNNHKDLNGRLAIRPFGSSDAPPSLQCLQFGISAGFGVEQEPVNPTGWTTPATVPWFKYSSTVVADGVRNRLSPEIVYFNGPFGIVSQYMIMDQELRPSATGATYRFKQDVPTWAYFVMSTYLLTGETRTTYSMPITPLHNFDPCHPCTCPGAWELVGRIERMQVGEGVFISGSGQLANPGLYSSGATEMTLGFNWYLNKWFRTQFNYEHDWFDQPVQFGGSASNKTQHQDCLLTRFQIIF